MSYSSNPFCMYCEHRFLLFSTKLFFSPHVEIFMEIISNLFDLMRKVCFLFPFELVFNYLRHVQFRHIFTLLDTYLDSENCKILVWTCTKILNSVNESSGSAKTMLEIHLHMIWTLFSVETLLKTETCHGGGNNQTVCKAALVTLLTDTLILDNYRATNKTWSQLFWLCFKRWLYKGHLQAFSANSEQYLLLWLERYVFHLGCWDFYFCFLIKLRIFLSCQDRSYLQCYFPCQQHAILDPFADSWLLSSSSLTLNCALSFLFSFPLKTYCCWDK